MIISILFQEYHQDKIILITGIFSSKSVSVFMSSYGKLVLLSVDVRFYSTDLV